MRLWSIHPKHLDARGLVALWREALLAQAVLRGRTRGYRRHPQLDRFREGPRPVATIAAYLRAVHDEATRRGYAFDAARIVRAPRIATLLTVPDGQMAHEWAHLTSKLARRDRAWLARVADISPSPHPLFRVVPGGVAPWERAT